MQAGIARVLVCMVKCCPGVTKNHTLLSWSHIKRMKYSRNFLSQGEISCAGRNFLSQEEIYCHRRKFLSKEEMSCHGKTFLVTERIFITKDKNFKPSWILSWADLRIWQYSACKMEPWRVSTPIVSPMKKVCTIAILHSVLDSKRSGESCKPSFA